MCTGRPTDTTGPRTKSETARRLAIEPTLVPLLAAIHKRAGRPRTGRVLQDMPPWHDLAKGLRLYVALAGLTHVELHRKGPTRRWLPFHDLRATGVTWMAVRGDDPLKIRQRAGHQHLVTTERYIRLAKAVRVGRGSGRRSRSCRAGLCRSAVGGRSAHLRRVSPDT